MLAEILARHKRIALQFSGGKDSLAILHLLREFWPKLTVYWLNTGDAPKETLTQMQKVKKSVPNFVEVAGNSPSVIHENGWPTDLIRTEYTRIAREMAGEIRPFIMQDRLHCCYQSIMSPLHERMVADQITLIIRGQRNADAQKGPLRDQSQVAGIEYMYPIEAWTDAQVLAYLAANNIAIPEYYEDGGSSIDCLHCTGYWEHKVDHYLSKNHPIAYNERHRRIKLIKTAIADKLLE